MIISRTIKSGNRKWRINVTKRVFRRVAQRTPHVFGALSIMSCATAVNDFLGVLCATIGVSCSNKCSTMWTRIVSVSLLSSINFLCYDHWCPMLRPLSCVTIFFCDHNFSLICRFRPNFKFSQNYLIIDTYLTLTLLF